MGNFIHKILDDIRRAPLWVWIGLGLTLVLIYFAWRQSQQGSSTITDTGTPTDPTVPTDPTPPGLPIPPTPTPVLLPQPPAPSAPSGGSGITPGQWINTYAGATDSQSDPSYGSGPPPTYPGHYTDASSDPTYGATSRAIAPLKPGAYSGGTAQQRQQVYANKFGRLAPRANPPAHMTHPTANRPPVSLTLQRMQKQRG